MMEDLEKLDAMLDDIYQLVQGDESKRSTVFNAFSQFVADYGTEWISEDIKLIVLGEGSEQKRRVEKLLCENLEWDVFCNKINNLFIELRSKILMRMCVHDKGYDYLPKIEEVTNNIKPLLEELNKIYLLAFNNKTILDEIRKSMNLDEFFEKIKKGGEAAKNLEKILYEMKQGQQKLDRVSRQVGGVQNSMTRLIASHEGNYAPTAEEAAKWYGVNKRTIQNWMIGKGDDLKYWPGNSATMKEYTEGAARYRAVHNKTDGADDEGTWGPGSSMLDIGEINNGYSIK